MQDTKWTYPGSRWQRFDFHAHSPASDDYGRGNDALKEITPEDWLKKAMAAGLACVVVTDHNTGGWIDRLKAKNEELRNQTERPEWYRELTLFPGVEITVADSSTRIHLLGVFDPSCDTQTITAVLGACGIKKGFGDDKTTSTTTGFSETVKKIIDADGIAIPAHIDGKKGLLEGIRSLTPELEKSLEKISAAEFCDPHIFDLADPPLKKAMDHLAKLAGSDAHKPEDIGRHSSWIKMSRPSIAGLRLALMDHEFCVKNQTETPNHLPDIFLSQLTLSSMHHCGRINPFSMSLHPHFNAVIGGRGTGKSTLLESIRIVARREAELKPFDKLNNELGRFLQGQSGPKKNRGVMLDTTQILLEIHRRGKKFQLRWQYNGQGSVLEEKNSQGWQEIEAGNIHDRFPLSIYSQKQINELASNPRGLLEIVDRSFEVDRGEWDRRWEDEKSQFLQLREQLRKLSRQVSQEPQIRVKLQDVENDLKQYEDKGHGDILKHYQKRSQQKNSLPDDKIFETLCTGIRDLAQSAELSDFPAHLFDETDPTAAEIKTIHDKTAQGLKQVRDSLETLAQNVDALKKQKNEQMEASVWYQSLQSGIQSYKALVNEYEEKKSSLSISLYGEWVQQRNQLQQQLKKLNSVRTEIQTIGNQIKEKFQKLLDLRQELLEKRRNFLDQVIGASAFVRMELVQFGDISSLEEAYRNLLNLGDGTFSSSIFDNNVKQGILWDLRTWEDLGKTESEIAQLISTIKSDTFKIANGEATGNHGAFDNRLKTIKQTQPAVFDQLFAWWPEDLLRVKYSKDPASGHFADLEKGSAGQKAAAILAFLLSHGSEPLIIDQPEDDLDNALIYDLIVAQIHENKNRRQLIIVTHNPNIVVNGDAELVHVLKFENGQVQIDQEGGLEETSVRNAICNIMEGGRQAFDRRYKRITLGG
jgi:energy-coupling factor transporter ATP-binding protein EcfA2/histidinol phosphatase-like PHP family hydrolase